MDLSPRYGPEPVIDVDGAIPDVVTPLVRQRTRFAEGLAGLDPAGWATPSRCAGWSVQDVVEHLVGVNRFWALSMGSALRGEPTRLLADFDPNTVPAAMVEAARGAPPEATLDAFVATNTALAELLEPLDDAAWALLAEAPPGHLALRAVAAHALWDAWVHERDVLLPLGREPRVEPDEVGAALAYAAALGAALRGAAGSTVSGTFRLAARDPDIDLTLEVGREVTVRTGFPAGGGPVLEAGALRLLEVLSVRAPASELDDGHRWLAAGLGAVFSPPAGDRHVVTPLS